MITTPWITICQIAGTSTSAIPLSSTPMKIEPSAPTKREIDALLLRLGDKYSESLIGNTRLPDQKSALALCIERDLI